MPLEQTEPGAASTKRLRDTNTAKEKLFHISAKS